LREAVSRSEAKLWLYLSGGKLGVSFRRQHPIGPYFADYYCARLRLIVEVDGDGHDVKSDAARDEYMQMKGLHVLRFSAEDAFSSPEGVAETILNAVRLRSSDPLPASPLQGEE
jgi:very-short-patch-repair endonuclease